MAEEIRRAVADGDAPSKALEDENARLKKLAVELSLDREMLQDVVRAKWHLGVGRRRPGLPASGLSRAADTLVNIALAAAPQTARALDQARPGASSSALILIRHRGKRPPQPVQQVQHRGDMPPPAAAGEHAASVQRFGDKPQAGRAARPDVGQHPEADWEKVKSFCQDFAELLAHTNPSRFVANMRKAKRKGRMFLDYLRNGQGATAICPWSTRARPGASCAVLVTWGELPTLQSASVFDIFAAAARAHQPDAWEGYFDVQQTLTDRMRITSRARRIEDVVDLR